MMMKMYDTFLFVVLTKLVDNIKFYYLMDPTKKQCTGYANPKAASIILHVFRISWNFPLANFVSSHENHHQLKPLDSFVGA